MVGVDIDRNISEWKDEESFTDKSMWKGRL